MTAEDTLLKTRQVAEALGVSVSTIKRWVDAGTLPATKTVGKHRLIPLSEALRFARRLDLPRARLERMAGAWPQAEGVAETEAVEALDERTRDRLFGALQAGRVREARALTLAAYGSGSGGVALADRLIRPVMERIGHGWQAGAIEVYQEHRASQVVGSAVVELIQRMPPPLPGAPLAIGTTPEGDLYILSGLLCELVLRERGWEVMNLGPNLPLDSLARAVRAHRPRLAWLSVHHLADPEAFLREYGAFYETATTMGTAVILGGTGLTPALRAELVATGFGDRMAHLAEFARHVRPAGDAQTDATTERNETDPPLADEAGR